MDIELKNEAEIRYLNLAVNSKECFKPWGLGVITQSANKIVKKMRED